MEENKHFWGGQPEKDPHVEAGNHSLRILVSPTDCAGVPKEICQFVF